MAIRVTLGVLISMLVSLPAHADLVGPDTEYLVFHHRDVLGTAIATTDSNGNVVHHTSTTPYGRDLGRRADDGQGFSDNAYPSSRSGEGYTGHVNDRQLELTYMRARFYDPVLGRFLSNDPVGFTSENPTSFNRYAYANNSPYKYVDPDGRNAVTVFGGFLSETWEGLTGRGDGEANYSNLGGALKDGYDGEGAGFAESTLQDGLSFGAGALGALAKIGSFLRSAKAAKNTAHGAIDAGKGLGQNPFRGKTPEEIEEMLTKKRYTPRGPDPLDGRGTYVNPRNGRGYHIDSKHAEPKGPHVGVHRPRGHRESLSPRDCSLRN